MPRAAAAAEADEFSISLTEGRLGTVLLLTKLTDDAAAGDNAAAADAKVECFIADADVVRE